MPRQGISSLDPFFETVRCTVLDFSYGTGDLFVSHRLPLAPVIADLIRNLAFNGQHLC
jgi:hypothetical protein